MWSVKCGVWSEDYGVRSVECGGVQSVGCKVRSVECKKWSVKLECKV